MIEFKNVTLSHPHMSGAILQDANVLFGGQERIGILAAPGTGKSTLARVFGGIEQPKEGIVTSQNVSWPLGYAGFLHANLTVHENIASIARLVGTDPTYFVSLVAHLSELTAQLGAELRNLTPTQRAVLGYMITLAAPSRMLIADDKLTVGDAAMRRKCEAMLTRYLSHRGLIFLSRNARQMRQYCNRFFALHDARLIACDTPEQAQNLLTKDVEYV